MTGRPYPKALVATFAARRNRFNLIRELLDEHANPVTSPSGTPVGGGWKRVTSSDVTRVTEVGTILIGAGVATARSWVDTLLHACNLLFLNPPAPDRDVCIGRRFMDKLGEAAPTVAEHISRVLASAEFLYINDLTNAMKHRELIDTKAVIGSPGSHIVVDSFEKDGRSWEACTIAEIMDRCDSLFGELSSLLFSIPDLAIQADD